jgi:predicted DNA-binding transcriptional regulator YafY
MSARHRAPAWEHAERVNAAVRLLAELAPAAAARALAVERGISERQARRYIASAAAVPGGVVVPEPTAPVTIRLPRSLLGRLRSLAAERGTSVGALVAEALSVHLGEQRARGRRGGQAR